MAILKKHETNGAKVLHIQFDEADYNSFQQLTNSIVRKDLVTSPSDWLRPENFKFNASVIVEDLGYKAVVLISSLSSALLKIDAHDLFLEFSKLKEHRTTIICTNCFQILHKLNFTESVIQIICQIHLDVVDSTEFALLKALFSTIIHVEPSVGNKIPSYNMQHYKPNGKYFTEVVSLCIFQ